jgi:hypothetical protein
MTNNLDTTNQKLDKLLQIAADELTEYSTLARKIEKLRRKISLTLVPAEQEQILQSLSSQIKGGGIEQLVAEQRQTVALPFWGVAGLGLLLGISFSEPIGLITAFSFGAGAIAIQKWGWELQAKLLLWETLTAIKNDRQS